MVGVQAGEAGVVPEDSASKKRKAVPQERQFIHKKASLLLLLMHALYIGRVQLYEETCPWQEDLACSSVMSNEFKLEWVEAVDA